MQAQTDHSKQNNIIVGPDYGMLMKQSTNAAIIQAFIGFLFNPDVTFGWDSLSGMLGTLLIVLFIKTLLENTGEYINAFRFSDITRFRYYYQRIWHKEFQTKLVLDEHNKWSAEITDEKNGTKKINIATQALNIVMTRKGITISSPATYFFNYNAYIVCAVVDSSSVTFYYPNIQYIITHINYDIILQNREIVTNGTKLSKFTGSPGGAFDPLQPINAFPTKNYEALEKMIKIHFVMDKIFKTGASYPLCVNFDGPPGTGKTTFTSYIASKGIFDNIVYHNMLGCNSGSDRTFKNIIQSIDRTLKNNSKGGETILLVLDEIDKWFWTASDKEIHKLREEARGKKQIASGAGGKDATGPTIIQGFDKLTPEEENERKYQYRNEFFDSLYEVVDGHVLSDTKRYVIVFNTNHFDTLFHNIAPKYEALLNRFNRFHFGPMNKSDVLVFFDELSDNIKEFSKKDDEFVEVMKTSNIEKFMSIDENIKAKIPKDISITYRELGKIIKKYHCDIDKIVTNLSEHKNKESITVIPDFILNGGSSQSK